MKTIEELNLTQLETSFIKSLNKLLFAEPGFTDVQIKELSEKMGVSVETGKGVLGSLIKKGIVDSQKEIYNDHIKVGRKFKIVNREVDLIILNPDYYYLHPNWGLPRNWN